MKVGGGRQNAFKFNLIFILFYLYFQKTNFFVKNIVLVKIQLLLISCDRQLSYLYNSIALCTN